MPRTFRVLIAATMGVILWGPACAHGQDSDAGATDRFRFFEQRIRPLLIKRCFRCHSHKQGKADGGLVLDTRRGWADGGGKGPAVIPGQPQKSLLLRAVRHQVPGLKMPPGKKLPEQEIRDLAEWIRRGAADPRVDDPQAAVGAGGDEDHWAFRPLARPKLPTKGDRQPGGLASPVDVFVSTRLAEAGMSLSDTAGREVLLRRVTFDLTGLPPTEHEMSAFLKDRSPGAWERVVDRLLASPHYGEHWGRHWLDLARYADSNGADINYAHAHAWRYRDYVVDSFNADRPYDEFLREQLAGDLLGPGTSAEERNRRLTATGFLMMGPKMLAEVDTTKLLLDVVDEQLDVTMRTVIGLTVGCARCHDHKFDPISTRDYYALAGIFRSTRSIDVLRDVNTQVSEWMERDLEVPGFEEKLASHSARIQQVESALATLGATPRPPKPGAGQAVRSVHNRQLPAILSTTWTAWVRPGSRRPHLDAVVSAAFSRSIQGHSLGFHTGPTALHPRVVWNHGPGSHRIIMSEHPLGADQWHHLAVSYDGTSRDLVLYVDGQAAAKADNVESTPFTVVGVGRRESSSDFGFGGDVDQVAIYSRALGPAEIAADMTGNHPRPHLVLLWEFEDVVSGRIPDSSGHGHEGRIVGFGLLNDAQRPAGRRGRGLSFARAPTVALTEARRADIKRLRAEWKELEDQRPAAPRVMAVRSDQPVDLPVLQRGSHLAPGRVKIRRNVPAVLRRRLPMPRIFRKENGRAKLARWLTDHRHPLTARVIVNRIWQWHFGQGLVRTPSNFGIRGDRPSHPGLLDWLATELMSHDWSIKHLHRVILMSRTYRQQHDDTAAGLDRDPDNRLLWRHEVRRLPAEAIRDSLLFVADVLDRQMRGTVVEQPNMKRTSLQPGSREYETVRRGLYLPVIRVRGYEMFTVFDFQTSGEHLAKRPTTTVPQQALFMLNNPLVSRVARRLANRVLESRSQDDHVADDARDRERIDRLYRVVYGRRPSGSELEAAVGRLESLRVIRSRDSEGKTSQPASREAAWSDFCHLLIAANEFVFVK